MPTADYSSYHQPPATVGDGTKLDNFIDAVQATVNGLDNNNIAAAAGILLTKLAQVGATSGQAIVWNGSNWAPSTITTTYRKTTAKTVNTTVAETDLLNGEITLAANDLGTSRVLRLSAHGDWLQNSGASRDVPRFKLKLGATTLLDTGVTAGTPLTAGATRGPWWIDAVIAETGATNAQSCSFRGRLLNGGGATAAGAVFATGEGANQTAVGSAEGFVTYDGWASAAVDGTGSLALALSVILPVSNASCEIVLKDALVVIE